MNPDPEARPIAPGRGETPEAPDSPAAPTGKSCRNFLLSLAALVAAADYANILGNRFVWDDHLQIVSNPDLRKLSDIGKAFSGPVWSAIAPHGKALSGFYRPLQALVYTLVYQVWRLHPSGYHLVSILFHALTTVALFLLVVELAGSSAVALGAASFFAVDPIHTEAVDWIAALPDLQCALFYVLSLYCWVRWRRTPQGERASRRWLAAACVAFFLALLSKEMAITLPLAVLLYERFFEAEKSDRPAGGGFWAGAACLGVAFAAYLGLRAWALKGLLTNPNGHALTAGEYVLSDLALVGGYFQKVFLPARLNAYYVFSPSTSFWNPHVLLGAAWIILCVAAVGLGNRWPKSLRLPVFGIVWILLSLIPVLAINHVGYNVFAERYLYLPSVGACLAAAALLCYLYERGTTLARRAALALGVAIVLVFSVQTVLRNRVWKNDFTLCKRTIRASPDAAPMYNGLAQVYSERGENEEALTTYREARDAVMRQYRPNPLFLANAYSGMGTAYLAMGQTTEAERAFHQALDYSPYPDAYLNLGAIAFRERDYQKAYTLSLQAIQILPVYGLAYNNAGAALLAMGQTAKAIPYLEKAVEFSPDYTQAHFNLALAYQQTGQLLKAVEQTRAVLEYDPNNKLAARYLERLLNVPSGGAPHSPVQK